MGTYRGIPGTFTCTNGCIVATGARRNSYHHGHCELCAVPAKLRRYDAPDTAYTYFGWWLNKPKANNGVHDVEVFAGGIGTNANPVSVTAEMTGDATYVGAAAGKYVTKTSMPVSRLTPGVGHFTAAANLTASFR